jgi:cytochrome c peroxidase
MTSRPLLVSLLLATLTAGCGSGEPLNPTGNSGQLPPVAALGKKIFEDPSLSASGKLACAGCHVQTRAYASDDDRAVPLGGSSFTNSRGAATGTPGFRNTPSLRYLELNPAFLFDAEGTPTGGFNRDGRANSLAAQARRPFIAPHEMANASEADAVTKLSKAAYSGEFKALFGSNIFDNPDIAFARVLFAIQQYEKSDPDFHPYTSKYDAFLTGQAQLTAQELRGLALFNNPQKGNCAGCHPSRKATDGTLPVFTDFTYDDLGVPRNAAIPANSDATYFDLGLCGPDRTDLANRRDLCGAFKVPTLRNIAITAPYFHNGKFDTLEQVVGFYARRDTNPEEWYSRNADGTVNKFDDLPPDLIGNVNTREVPYNRQLGDVPALSTAEINDMVAFLKTLTDGFLP